MNKISLTASMRSNLLSLQNISGQVSSTQNKLATGKKVNSAIDNPSSYYTALSLNNRADDLNALLDSMGQAVSTIKAATTTLESATDFLEQAKAVANQALETAQPIVAQVSTEDELLAAIESGKSGLIVVNGNINLSENQTLALKDGQSLIGAGTKDKLTFNITDKDITKAVNMGNNSSVSNLNISLRADDVASLFVSENKKGVSFSNLNVDFFIGTATSTAYADVFSAIKSEVSIGGQINIKAQGFRIRGLGAQEKSFVKISEGSEFNLEVDGLGVGGTHRIAEIFSGSILDICENAKINGKFKNSTGVVGVYIRGGKLNIHSAELNFFNMDAPNNYNYGLMASQGGILDISGKSIIKLKANNTNFRALATEASQVGSGIFVRDGSEIHIGQNGSSSSFVTGRPSSGENIISFEEGTRLSVKDDARADKDGYWQLSKDWAQIAGLTGTIVNTENFNTIDEFVDTGESYQMFTDLPAINFDTVVWNTEDDIEEISQYQDILNQYDSLIKDASYKGINLLQTDKLSVKFNEDNTASLNVQGKDMSTQALGFTVFEWQTQGDINKSLEELTSAINAIRNYSSELGNNYNIITTRQDFTESLINVLTEGADKLTLADMNEESANMLALQTRQQLAINSLSLASQASQSILKLF